MDRRQFLQAISMSSFGLSFPPLKASSYEDLNHTPHLVNPTESTQGPHRLPNNRNRSVLVIGGGIAGLSAALGLAEKGFAVTIKESEPYFGGRLHTRQERLTQGSFRIEHGLHMWFQQYYNFRDILQNLGTWDRYFIPFNKIFFKFKTYQDEVLKSEGPYPINLARIVLSSPNLNFLEAAQTFAAMKDVIFYRHDKVFEKFDHLSFAQWAQKNWVHPDFYRVIMEPAASVTLNATETISAAEMILFMHLYFIGKPDAFHRKIPIVDHGQAVIDPWIEKLRRLGATVHSQSPCQGLILKNQSIIAEVGSNHTYDQVILACNISGIKSILANSYAQDRSSSQRLRQFKMAIDPLKVASPYHIMRVWFDRPINPDRPFYQSVIETPENRPINLIANYGAIEAESKEWTQRTNGSILEFHLYNSPQYFNDEPLKIWRAIQNEVYEVFPEVVGAKLLDITLGRYHNFTSFEVGQARLRPKSDYPRTIGIRNLGLAGDWLHTDYPSALMERSVSTGLEAANLVLKQEGIRQIPIKSASLKGPGIVPRW